MSGLTLGATVAFAVTTGATTFFAPCAFPLLPGYVGYYIGAESDDGTSVLSGALVRGVAASVGVLATFGVLAVAAVTVGQPLQAHLSQLELVVGVLLVALGLWTLSGRTTGWHARLTERRTSIAGFVGFGGLYAVAATGCVAPVFLAVVSQALTFGPVGTAAVLGGYAAGMAVLMIAATVAVAVGVKITTDRFAGLTDRLTPIAGGIVVGAGLVQVWLALFVYTV
jgi:cytochrome c-type biogenesis protein